MGTRSAPFIFLWLTACMAANIAPPETRVGGDLAPASVVIAPALPVALPTIPRMRPKPPRKPQSTGVAAQTSGAANTSGKKRTPSAVGTARSTDGAGSGRVAGAVAAKMAPTDGYTMTAAANNLDLDESGASNRDPESPMAGVQPQLSPPPYESAELGSTMPDPVRSADAVADSPADNEPGNDSADERAIDLAAFPPPEPGPGIDVESLFDGDVVRYCAAMWQMGEYIGAARRRGDPFKRAIGEAVRRIADEKQLPLDNRLAFSGQVYGRLVYRLEERHAALTFGTYVHFACLTVRGDKKIVPADPNAERLLNSGLAHCESTSFTRDDLNDCIFRELTPVVDRRNS